MVFLGLRPIAEPPTSVKVPFRGVDLIMADSICARLPTVVGSCIYDRGLILSEPFSPWQWLAFMCRLNPSFSGLGAKESGGRSKSGSHDFCLLYPRKGPCLMTGPQFSLRERSQPA